MFSINSIEIIDINIVEIKFTIIRKKQFFTHVKMDNYCCQVLL